MIVVTVDTLRADHVNATVTPALDRLARESVRFDTAVTVAPVTLPAHASLLTGTYPPAHGVRDNQIFSLAPEHGNLHGMVEGARLRDGAFVSAIVLDHRYGLNSGFDTYDDEMNGAPNAARARRSTAPSAGWAPHASPSSCGSTSSSRMRRTLRVPTPPK